MQNEKWPSRILMVRPNGYRIESCINPHMKNAKGELNVVDTQAAWAQWTKMRDLYKYLSLEVHEIDGQHELPDMVFCANQTFSYIDPQGRRAVVIAKMKSATRQPEVKYFKDWAELNGLQIHSLAEVDFEGCGDAIWNYETGEIFGGYGFRSSKEAYRRLAELVPNKIYPLELIDSRFYHLDTCLVVLNATTAAYVEEAFAPESVAVLKSKFSNLIRIKKSEALKYFAGNAFCVDGKNVVLHRGAENFVAELKKRNFKVHEVDTSEFLKSGGSVFCCKQLFY